MSCESACSYVIHVLLSSYGLGSAEAVLYGALPQNKRNVVVSYFATFVVKYMDGGYKIYPEWDKASNAADVLLTPVLPNYLATLMPSSFIEVVIHLRSRLLTIYGDSYIVALEEEDFALRVLYVENREFHTILDNTLADADFHNAWMTIHPKFPKLCVRRWVGDHLFGYD